MRHSTCNKIIETKLDTYTNNIQTVLKLHSDITRVSGVIICVNIDQLQIVAVHGHPHTYTHFM